MTSIKCELQKLLDCYGIYYEKSARKFQDLLITNFFLNLKLFCVCDCNAFVRLFVGSISNSFINDILQILWFQPLREVKKWRDSANK